MARKPEDTSYYKRSDVPTALTQLDALPHHLAHESLFATGCDHLNFRTGADLRAVLNIDQKRQEPNRRTALGWNSFAAADREASSVLE